MTFDDAGRNVALRLALDPRFPEWCAGCGSAASLRHVTVRRLGIRAHKAVVPMCGACAWGHRLGRLTRAAYWLAVFAMGAMVASRPFDGQAWMITRLLTTFAIASFAYPLACIWSFLAPPPVDCARYDGYAAYCFRDRAYAAQFAALNGTRTY